MRDCYDTDEQDELDVSSIRNGIESVVVALALLGLILAASIRNGIESLYYLACLLSHLRDKYPERN